MGKFKGRNDSAAQFVQVGMVLISRNKRGRGSGKSIDKYNNPTTV